MSFRLSRELTVCSAQRARHQKLNSSTNHFKHVFKASESSGIVHDCQIPEKDHESNDLAHLDVLYLCCISGKRRQMTSLRTRSNSGTACLVSVQITTHCFSFLCVVLASNFDDT